MLEAVTLKVPFNHQQIALLDRFLEGEGVGATSHSSLVKEAIQTFKPYVQSQPQTDVPAPSKRKIIAEYLLEPGTGKAVPVLKGQIIRIEQVEGGQCGDFLVYNLHNRHEHLQVGRTRTIHGNSPSTGDMLWSNGPWERPLMSILANSGKADTLFPPCSAILYSRFFGMCNHTNCGEIQTEAHREYGLQAHDVHESFNLFMYVEVGADGTASIKRNQSRKGDFIEFVAMMDVLAIPNVCGDDYGKTSNFWLRPLKVLVMEPLQEDMDRLAEAEAVALSYVLPTKYEAVEVPPKKDETYEARFPHLPIRVQHVDVDLDEVLFKKFDAIRDRTLYGDDFGAAARDIMMAWVGERMDW